MIIIEKNTGILIDIVDTTEQVENGLLVTKGEEKYIYGMAQDLDVLDVAVTEGVVPQKYKYINGNFEVNADYVEPEINSEIK